MYPDISVTGRFANYCKNKTVAKQLASQLANLRAEVNFIGTNKIFSPGGYLYVIYSVSVTVSWRCVFTL